MFAFSSSKSTTVEMTEKERAPAHRCGGGAYDGRKRKEEGFVLIKGGPIKSVAIAGSTAVSFRADDTIKIYELSPCSEIGSLNDHFATVTALCFFTPPSLSSFPHNLLFASDDGNVSIYDADPFVHLKTLTAHKRASTTSPYTHRGSYADGHLCAIQYNRKLW